MILSDQTCNCAENAGWIQPLPDDKCRNLEIYIGHLLFTPLIHIDPISHDQIITKSILVIINNFPQNHQPRGLFFD